jgi:hypothetical protein
MNPPKGLIVPGEKYDCEATLTDEQVVEFCKNGFMMLEEAVPGEVNRRTVEFLDRHPQTEPNKILGEEWFADAVVKNPRAAGAVRSLLGRDFKLPAMMSNHRVQCPQTSTGGWHRDGGAVDSNRLDSLQVFYYPQDTPAEMGPTEVLPSSHLLRVKRRYMTQYGSIRQAVRTVAPAGSIFITHYSIWHRATTSTASGIRNLLKYNYWRTAPPRRDWAADPGCDFTEIQFGTGRNMPEKWHDSVRVVRLFLWLCGGGEFAFSGGQSWPITCGSGNHIAEGMPPELQPRG